MNSILNDFKQPRIISLQGKLEEALPKQHQQNQWSPYELNGGNIVAVVQDDIAVLAGDTRISRGYSILKRDGTKIHQLTQDTWILTGGMYADMINLWKLLDEQIKLYQVDFERIPSSNTIASLLSRILYRKRNFPYYTFNTVIGFNKEGNAELWSYDAIGSFDKSNYGAQGSNNDMILPLLDSQFKGYHSKHHNPKKSPEELVEIVIDVFTSTAERDITCGDGVEVVVLKKGTLMSKKIYPLRKD